MARRGRIRQTAFMERDDAKETGMDVACTAVDCRPCPVHHRAGLTQQRMRLRHVAGIPQRIDRTQPDRL